MSQERRTGRWWKDRFMASHYGKLKGEELLVAHMIHKGFVDKDNDGRPVIGPDKRPKLQYSRFARQVSMARTDILGHEKRVSRQMITQLCLGIRRSCTTDLALAIEQVLDVPAHMLFEVLPKSLDTRQTVKREAA